MPIDTSYHCTERDNSHDGLDLKENKKTKKNRPSTLSTNKRAHRKTINNSLRVKNSSRCTPINSHVQIMKASVCFLLLISKIENRLSLVPLSHSRRLACDNLRLESVLNHNHCTPLQNDVTDRYQHDADNIADYAQTLAYNSFSFLPMMAEASALNDSQIKPAFALSDLFIRQDPDDLFYQYNTQTTKNSHLLHLAIEKKRALFEKGHNAIINYYNHFNQHHPSLKTRARTLLAEKIKEKFNIDLNPDQTYFMHFTSAYSTPETFTGWSHIDPPIEWGPLTRYMFTNFPADAQENIDTTNFWCGIYNFMPNMTTKFSKEGEVRIRPEDFIRLIWDIDFYQKAKSAYLASYADKNAYIKKNFMDFILNLAANKPDQDATHDLLAGVGLIEDNNVIVTQFDLNGYKASNLFVFTNKKAQRVTLYMPNHQSKFFAFSNIFDMRSWIIHNCVDQTHRDIIASHFSLYNRQDGIVYDGIDSWLKTLSREVIAEEYMDKICTHFTPLSTHRFFEEMTSLAHDRFLKDLDILIKSDAEVTRDIWERDIDASNIILNPVSPFISLGFHLEHALDGDTEQERLREWNNVANDVISLILMVLMEKTMSLATDGYDFIDTIKNDITSGIANHAFDELLPTAEITLSEIEQIHMIETDNTDRPVFVSSDLLQKIDQVPTLDESLLSHIEPNSEGVFRYHLPHDPAEKMAIRVNNKFYSLRNNGQEGIYLLDNGDEIAILDEVYYSRNTHPDEDIRYLPCQAKRVPGTSCLHFSEGLNELLLRMTPDAMTRQDVGATYPHLKYKSLLVNQRGKLFIPFGDAFFQIKESNSGFKILGKKRAQLLRGLLNRKTIGKFHLSRTNGMYYLNTPIENTMECLGCSKAAAELYNFNIKNTISSDLVTREELYAIKSYGNMGFDPINTYMQEGMPKTNTVPLNSEALLSDTVRNIRSLLNKLPSYKGTVYRGGMLTREELATLKPGDIITSKKFISTTTDKNIARGYTQSRGAEGVFYTMHIIKRGHPIGMYTMRIHEAEVLIEDGTPFMCTAVNGNNVDLMELSDVDNAAAHSVKVVSM